MGALNWNMDYVVVVVRHNNMPGSPTELANNALAEHTIFQLPSIIIKPLSYGVSAMNADFGFSQLSKLIDNLICI